MNQRSRTRALFCLTGLLVSLLLAGAVVAHHHYLARSAVTGLPAPIAEAGVATPGLYPASTALATFEGHWELNPPGASAMADGDTVSLPFEGTGVALTVARSPYMGYLYVTLDGRPANALPRDPQGRAFVPLYGTLDEITTIPLATGLPEGRHTVTVTAQVCGGGWWLADSLSRALHIGGRRLFPSLIRPNLAAIAVPALFLALAWAWSRRPTLRAAAAAVTIVGFTAVIAAGLFLPEWRVDAEDPHVVHHGGRAHPPSGTFFRAAKGISWRLEAGQFIEIPWRPPPASRLFVRLRRSHGVPALGRLTARWDTGSLSTLRWAGEGWQRLPIPLPAHPGRGTLRLSWEAPDHIAVFIDRVEAPR